MQAKIDEIVYRVFQIEQVQSFFCSVKTYFYNKTSLTKTINDKQGKKEF